MKYLIAIPCMDMVHTHFMASLLGMRRPDGTEVGICSSSLIYDARNNLAMKAVNERFDRVLWLDSDMTFGEDMMEKLIADMDEGRDFVSALYFTRKKPIKPCIYSSLAELENGYTKALSYEDYPKGQVFQVGGCGFGAVMMSTKLITDAGNHDRPFSPKPGWGEDFSFEIRAQEAGHILWCDSRIKCGHVGLSVIDESTWEGTQ